MRQQELLNEPYGFLTAPQERIVLRKGDPLGFRDVADFYAELLAPGLSRRTTDLRWVTLLSWCLRYAQPASVRAARGKTVLGPESYEWIRPLELLWIARTVLLDQKPNPDRQLNGIDSIKPLFANAIVPRELPDQFGMGNDQWARYRFTGVYGAYRVAFRTWDGLTENGDGWTPAPLCIVLADWVDAQLPTKEITRIRESITSLRKYKTPERWWFHQMAPSLLSNFPKTGSKAEASAVAHTLPSLRSESALLPEASKIIELTAALSGGTAKQSPRQWTINIMKRSLSAASEQQLCEAIAATADTYPREDMRVLIRALPHFARVADAALCVIERMYEALIDEESIELKWIQCDAELEELVEASGDWLSHEVCSDRRFERVTALCKSVQRRNKQRARLLSDIAAYHNEFGGGLRWFYPNGQQIVRNVAPTGNPALPYTFRLRQLARLAVQAGLMPRLPACWRHQAVPDNEEQ